MSEHITHARDYADGAEGIVKEAYEADADDKATHKAAQQAIGEILAYVQTGRDTASHDAVSDYATKCKKAKPRLFNLYGHCAQVADLAAQQVKSTNLKDALTELTQCKNHNAFTTACSKAVKH